MVKSQDNSMVKDDNRVLKDLHDKIAIIVCLSSQFLLLNIDFILPFTNNSAIPLESEIKQSESFYLMAHSIHQNVPLIAKSYLVKHLFQGIKLFFVMLPSNLTKSYLMSRFDQNAEKHL